MKDLIPLIKMEAASFKIESAAVMAFIDVETGGRGFASDTGKIMIQFEPAWFRKVTKYAPSGLWSVNKVDVQHNEWLAFNDAFYKNKEAALECTSIGLGQIMGFHWKRLGYNCVHDLWNDAKKGLDRQIWQICKFISTDAKLLVAIKSHDWDTVATLYNGAGYKDIAAKYGREPYNISLNNAYYKYRSL
jgi:hypothetical protein